MPDLKFNIEGAEPLSFAITPLIALKLRLTNNSEEESIRSISLNCQVRILTQQRKYNGEEQKSLYELFGEPERWGKTLRPMLWTNASINVPSFIGDTLIDLPVVCTFDFNVAAAKFFAALEDGEVPIELLFSGTIFYQTPEGDLQIAQIPWDREAQYRLPVRVWREMMDIYYPNSAWLCLRRDIFDRLYRYKVENGLTTFDEVLNDILPRPESPENAMPIIEAALKV